MHNVYRRLLQKLVFIMIVDPILGQDNGEIRSAMDRVKNQLFAGLFFRKYDYSCCLTAASIILLTMLIRESGWWFEGSDAESLLCTGIIDANFHCCGKFPCKKHRQQRRPNGPAFSALHSLKTIAGIWSARWPYQAEAA